MKPYGENVFKSPAWYMAQAASMCVQAIVWFGCSLGVWWGLLAGQATMLVIGAIRS